MNIQGIFLDLDDTLYDYQPCNEAGRSAALECISTRLHRPMSVVQEAFSKGREETKQHLRHEDFTFAASHSRLLYLQKTIERLTKKTNPSLVLEAERIFWENFLAHMKIFPGALEFLKRASSKKKTLAIVTDMTAHIQLQKLIKLGIGDYVDFIISSEEAGREKPHPAPLELALKKTALKPHETVMIGEDESRDIAAARAAAITPIAIRFRPSDPSVLFAKDFTDLENLLRL